MYSLRVRDAKMKILISTPLTRLQFALWIKLLMFNLLLTLPPLLGGQIVPSTGQIALTTIPAYGDISTPLTGRVVGLANPSTYAVAPLIFVEGLGWYSKPVCAQTTVLVQSDGTWSLPIVDPAAIRIAAFVVPVGTMVACTLGSAGLPSALISQSVGHLVINRPDPFAPTLTFAGFKWKVKANFFGSPIFPGPCVFSNSANNIWVDGYGFLHLRVTKDTTGNWNCAEVYSQRVFGYGQHSFTLGSQVSNFDPNLVLGLFTFDDIDASFSNREIDIEFSRFGNPSDTNNAQFVIQPAAPNRFIFPSDINSLQLFEWRPSEVFFSSFGANGQLVNQLPDTSGVPRIGTQEVRMNLWIFNQVPPTIPTEVIIQDYRFVPHAVDYDGDGILDYAIWRPLDGSWWVINTSSPDSYSFQQWGAAGDIAVSRDFDGDGKRDYAVWRPSNGVWYIIPSSDPSQPLSLQWGLPGDVPVPADYDGDGIADLAVWRPSNGVWYIIPSSSPSQPVYLQWGQSGDIPVPADYDGDGIADLAVWRPSTGSWFVVPSTNSARPFAQQWGAPGDVPVPEDYDGDGVADLAVWRPMNGVWYVIPSSNPSKPVYQQWGASGDIPVPRDYDNDAKADFGVWRPGNGVWYVIPSSTPENPRTQQWGALGDIPVYKQP